MALMEPVVPLVKTIGFLVLSCDLLAQPVNTAVYAAVVLSIELFYPLNDNVRFLGSCPIVQVYQWLVVHSLLKERKIVSDLFNI